MMIWKLVLAAMVWLQPPGQSLYSMTPVAPGSAPAVTSEVNGVRAYRLLEAGEEQPFACSQKGNPACSKPHKRDVVYNLVTLRTEHMRVETYDEGVRRYAMIAKAIDDVVSEQQWSYPPGQLWRLLVTIAFHESGFRRDIHAGRGRSAIGDCRARKTPTGPKAIAGSCRSHGLFQTLFASPKRTKHFGLKARDVIGVDPKSTRRAVRLAVQALERFEKGCRLRGEKLHATCVFAGYGGVTAPRHPGILKRAATYRRLGRAPAKLDAYLESVLSSD